jgi:isopentenyl phosphate kinase
MQNITLVKLGGSIITDKTKPYTPLLDNIKRIAREIKVTETSLLLAHGSGSFGHTSARIYGGKKGYTSELGIARVCHDAMKINTIVMDILLEEGLPAVALRPMSMMLAAGGDIKLHLFRVIEEALAQGLLPVVYGDVILDTAWKSTIYSGEVLLNNIGRYLLERNFSLERIIFVGNTDGFYNSRGETIAVIDKESWTKVHQKAAYNVEHDVTGGMHHKVEQALLMAQRGIPTWIINGNIPGELSNALEARTTSGTVVK